jgi:glyoxylase-like metal-dependent hydrolase (beta-lactamase superfamily II)
MFGVVPKPLWSQAAAPDEWNRIPLETNCLLIESPGILALCDTGFGTKLPEKEKAHLDATHSRSLTENLQALNISPASITHVIFSHLHFDHAGGATTRNSAGQLELCFPNAVHVFQEQEIADATENLQELEGNYHLDEMVFLRENANSRVVQGDSELLPGLQVAQTGGHTAGHQTIWIKTETQNGVYLGDLCPTAAHLNVFWTMAYDTCQIDVRRKKFELLNQIAQEQTLLFFDHDPQIRAATIKPRNAKSFEIDQVYEL